MPDALNPIVQRMIDAGESEENIATVIRHYKQAAPKAVADSEPGTFLGGAAQSIRDTVSGVGRGIVEGLNPLTTLKGIVENGTDAMPYKPNDTAASAMARMKANDAPSGPSVMATVKGLSDPETGGRAIGNLAQAGITGRLVSAGLPSRATAAQGLRAVSEFDFKQPFKSTVGKLADVLDRPPTPAAEPPPTAPKPTGPLSDIELARQEVAAGRLPQSVLAAIERSQQSASKTPPGMIRGSLRQVTPESPMQQPRVNVGAEVVGRQNGLTKEAVRQQTAPILGEQPGEASPILPEQALGKIIDTLKQMPPGSPEREAYVARATSGKAQWQIENIRRTLEHLGLIVPIAAAAPTVRDRVMQKLSAGQ